ncbi:MAG: hypothetical protein Q9206_000270 [Seirophora lacunosa]
MPLGAAEYGSEEQLNIPPYANQGSQARKYCFTKGPRAGEQNSDDPDKVAYHSGSGTLRLWHRESPMDKDDEGIPRRMKQRRSFGDGHVSSAGTLRPQWQGIMWSTSNMALQSPLLHAQVQVRWKPARKRSDSASRTRSAEQLSSRRTYGSLRVISRILFFEQQKPRSEEFDGESLSLAAMELPQRVIHDQGIPDMLRVLDAATQTDTVTLFLQSSHQGGLTADR